MKQLNLNDNQAILWCPPIAGKIKPLSYLWNGLDQCLADVEPSQLAKLIDRTLSDSEVYRAEDLISLWRQAMISRYNNHHPKQVIDNDYILVICSDSDKRWLVDMVTKADEHARQFNINTILVIDDRPEGINLCNKAIPELANSDVEVRVLDKAYHHATVIADAFAVYTFNSWLGFEALLWGKAVYVWGSPFYAGFGLTTDIQIATVKQLSLQQLVYFVFVEHTVSYDPASGEEIGIEQAIQWLELQNKMRSRFPARLFAVGFNRHWRRSVRTFFQGSEVNFVKTISKVPKNQTAVIWGNAPVNDAGVKGLLRLEDGFIRSVGLGALFAKPLSWIADSKGMYFDATRPSELEDLLNTTAFSMAQINAAQSLRRWLCEHKVSKYNTGQLNWQKPDTPKKIILVPGQVEGDASIAYGAPDIKHNIALLKTAREQNPDAYIIYKPHPDVVAGARAAGVNEQTAKNYCNEIATKIDISAMLDLVDEVHVLTSLAGFEALLRGKKVVCYGLPFYAGWGLTIDKVNCARRQKKLTVDQLVAGCLLIYPMYLNYQSGYYAKATDVAIHLANLRNNKQKNTFWQKMLRKCLNFIRGKS